MRFKELSPADRMKAGGLAGLIVLVLFFLVHTMLGAVSPASPAPPPADPAPAVAEAGPPTAPAAPTLPAPSSPQTKMPSSVSADPPKGGIASMGSPAMAVHDPFYPPPGLGPATATKAAAAPPPAPHNVEPDIHISEPLPLLGVAGKGPEPAVASPPPAPDPEIRLVGYVHGDPAVATLQVDGRTLLLRPGDAIAQGYRLKSVGTSGVRIRHADASLQLRVGEALNENKGQGARPGQM